MLRVYRDDEGDLQEIANERVAVIGYGIQGRAQALNLRDSGLTVCVGNRADDYADRARQDGFEVRDEPRMRRDVQRTIARIRDGSFARELVEDQRAGHLTLSNLTDASHALPMGAAERRLRALLGSRPRP